MSSAIKVGDLVVVVKPGRCCRNSLGRIFTVADIERNWTYCSGCKKRLSDSELVARSDWPGTWHPVDSLKRIPPLSELEGEKREEEITA